MKYQVHGTDPATGKRLRLTLAAPDEQAARHAVAKRGLNIESITAIAEGVAAAVEPPAPAAPAVPAADQPSWPFAAPPATAQPAAVDAGALVASARQAAPHTPAYASHGPAAPAYTALRVVSMVLIVFGWIFVVLGVLSMAGAVIVGASVFSSVGRMGGPGVGFGATIGVMYALYIMLVFGLGATMTFGMGYGLRALRDIARNSYITAHR